jgi:hypothetical protein
VFVNQPKNICYDLVGIGKSLNVSPNANLILSILFPPHESKAISINVLKCFLIVENLFLFILSISKIYFPTINFAFESP